MIVRAVTDNPLQEAYAATRRDRRREFEELAAAGAFLAPDHLRPALQGDLALPTPLVADEARAEAA